MATLFLYLLLGTKIIFFYICLKLDIIGRSFIPCCSLDWNLVLNAVINWTGLATTDVLSRLCVMGVENSSNGHCIILIVWKNIGCLFCVGFYLLGNALKMFFSLVVASPRCQYNLCARQMEMQYLSNTDLGTYLTVREEVPLLMREIRCLPGSIVSGWYLLNTALCWSIASQYNTGSLLSRNIPAFCK